MIKRSVCLFAIVFLLAIVSAGNFKYNNENLILNKPILGNYYINQTGGGDGAYDYNHTVIANKTIVDAYGKWWYNMSGAGGDGDYDYNHTTVITDNYGKWFYNMTISQTNDYAYNHTIESNKSIWLTYSGDFLSTFNETYDSWKIWMYNQSDSIWHYNQTYSGSTYNETYNLWSYNQSLSPTITQWLYNQTYSGSTYNATYDSWKIWMYNQSSLSAELNLTKLSIGTNEKHSDLTVFGNVTFNNSGLTTPIIRMINASTGNAIFAVNGSGDVYAQGKIHTFVSLVVAGTSLGYSGLTFAGNNNVFRMNSATTNGNFSFYNLASNGNVSIGINTVIPDATLSINSSSQRGALRIYNNSGSDLFFINGTNGLAITKGIVINDWLYNQTLATSSTNINDSNIRLNSLNVSRLGVRAGDRINDFTIRNTPTFSGTGTLTFTTGSATIKGANTIFLSEIGIGDKVTVTGGTGVITAIENDTSMTMNVPSPSDSSLVAFTITKIPLRIENSTGRLLMFMDELGQLGIGEMSSDYLLSVGGDVNINDSVYVSTRGNLGIRTSAPVRALDVRDDAGINNTFFVNNSGAVSIGISAGESKFDLRGNFSMNQTLYGTADKVGIKTKTPTNTLTVVGDINTTKAIITPNITGISGQILVTDVINSTSYFKENLPSGLCQIRGSTGTSASYDTGNEVCSYYGQACARIDYDLNGGGGYYFMTSDSCSNTHSVYFVACCY